MRRPPAIPLVHPQYIEPSPKRLLRRPQHVPRFTRSLKPMQQNQSRPTPRLRLPMTLSKNPRPRLNFKLPRHTSPQRRKLPRPKSRRKRHQMSIPQKRRRSKFTHEEKFTIGRETAQLPVAPAARRRFSRSRQVWQTGPVPKRLEINRHLCNGPGLEKWNLLSKTSDDQPSPSRKRPGWWWVILLAFILLPIRLPNWPLRIDSLAVYALLAWVLVVTSNRN